VGDAMIAAVLRRVTYFLRQLSRRGGGTDACNNARTDPFSCNNARTDPFSFMQQCENRPLFARTDPFSLASALREKMTGAAGSLSLRIYPVNGSAPGPRALFLCCCVIHAGLDRGKRRGRGGAASQAIMTIAHGRAKHARPSPRIHIDSSAAIPVRSTPGPTSAVWRPQRSRV